MTTSRGYRPGFLTIGVMSTGQCMLFGHGPGPSTLMSGPADAFSIVIDAGANLASWLHPWPPEAADDQR